MPSTPPPPPPRPGPLAWSVDVRLRYCGGLEIDAAAENVLPGWGRGGERLSLLLRLRRRLLLAVTSRCGPHSPPPSDHRRPCKILRFLRRTWARVPRVTSVWRRNKQPPARVAAVPDRWDQRSRSPTRPIQCFRAMAWRPTSAATLRFVVAALAVAVATIAAFRITGGFRTGTCDSEPISRWAKFLEFMEHAPPPKGNYKWLLWLPNRGLKWILSK